MVEKNGKKIRYEIKIKGIVQGVGFRPFIYNIAKKYGLKGYILNDSDGVEIDIEGLPKYMSVFLRTIEESPPVLSKIIEIKKTEKPINGYSDFIIKESKNLNRKTTLISPDTSICEDCLKELFDKDDRRYAYPFINCTNCGPRYTIIKDIPYDRPNTTMDVFRMCDSCYKEYTDPTDRRFHAQPNGCQSCGPSLILLDAEGRKTKMENPVQRTVELLKDGYIVAIKGLGGFHLGCDAYNDGAVKTLRQRKRRYQKPLALMSPSIEDILKFAYVSEREKDTLTSPQRPILLLDKRFPNRISENVAPYINSYGVMLPYTPLHYLLLKGNFDALVMTSGNISEEPIAIDNDEALSRLKGIADFFLINNRDICVRSDDSVVRLFDNKLLPIRRARGFVPLPIFLKEDFPEILACGPMLKNTFCLIKNNKAFLSQHIGDLENLETLTYFDETVRHLKNILEIEPSVVAVDKHPDYISTRYGEGIKGVKLIRVQHHYAHIVSCMAENGLDKKVIGIALDGTGYGDDGKIWGGEVLISDLIEYNRVAHIQYMPLPGGDKAVIEPWRVGLAYIYETFSNDLKNMNLPFLKSIDKEKVELVISMIEKKINTPYTSSCGRLFDAISSIIGLRNFVDYEAQAAIELENIIDAKNNDKIIYNYSFSESEPNVIDIKPLIRDVVYDSLNKVHPKIISLRFHKTIAKIFLDISIKLRDRYKIDEIVLSGGCFQNIFLLGLMKKNLEENRFSVYTHSLVPPNDGGVSLGQAIVAGKILQTNQE